MVEQDWHKKNFRMLGCSSPTNRLLNEHKYIIDSEHASKGIRLQLGSEQLDEVIELIKGEGIQILDIQKEITGSEKLYKEIFLGDKS